MYSTLWTCMLWGTLKVFFIIDFCRILSLFLIITLRNTLWWPSCQSSLSSASLQIFILPALQSSIWDGFIPGASIRYRSTNSLKVCRIGYPARRILHHRKKKKEKIWWTNKFKKADPHQIHCTAIIKTTETSCKTYHTSYPLHFAAKVTSSSPSPKIGGSTPPQILARSQFIHLYTWNIKVLIMWWLCNQ